MASPKALAIKKKIEKKGATAVLEKRGEPVFDPTTRMNSASGTFHDIKVLIDSTSLVALGEIFGQDLVESGDLILYMHNVYLWGQPEKGDGVNLDGQLYDVITRRPVYYKKGEIVMWRMLVRYGKRNDSRAKGM